MRRPTVASPDDMSEDDNSDDEAQAAPSNNESHLPGPRQESARPLIRPVAAVVVAVTAESVVDALRVVADKVSRADVWNEEWRRAAALA